MVNERFLITAWNNNRSEGQFFQNNPPAQTFLKLPAASAALPGKKISFIFHSLPRLQDGACGTPAVHTGSILLYHPRSHNFLK
jgi:hypothetical protein